MNFEIEHVADSLEEVANIETTQNPTETTTEENGTAGLVEKKGTDDPVKEETKENDKIEKLSILLLMLLLMMNIQMSSKI